MHKKSGEYSAAGESLNGLSFRESDLVEALLQSVRLAKEEYRISIGLEHSLKILEIMPDSVLMCILPLSMDAEDVLSHMHLLLIEAFCQENNIRMLKLICPEDLWNLLEYDYRGEYADELEPYNGDLDDSLVVIQASKANHVEDENLRKFYDLAALHYHARPIVRLRS